MHRLDQALRFSAGCYHARVNVLQGLFFEFGDVVQRRVVQRITSESRDVDATVKSAGYRLRILFGCLDLVLQSLQAHKVQLDVFKFRGLHPKRHELVKKFLRILFSHIQTVVISHNS